MKHLLIAVCVLWVAGIQAQEKPFECTESWVHKIRKLAPDTLEVSPKIKRRVLIFDRFTGFNHWVIPHTTAVIKVLGEKSGAFVAKESKDVFSFEKKNLRKYDMVVLNNTCSKRPDRNLFLDALREDTQWDEDKMKTKATELEHNLIEYVRKGGGLMVVHGGIVMQNNSKLFSNLVGGSFDYHPPQQEVTLKPVDPEHPLMKAFGGKPFVHIDEPYLFNGAYSKKNFRPLLYMDTDELSNKPRPIDEKIKYVSWIKRFGKGRVFYVSPSHNAQSFEDPRLLKFYLDGIQYVLGDFSCDDSPIGN